MTEQSTLEPTALVPLQPGMKILVRNPIMLLAFGFGSGLAPRAPGTAGSVVALLFMPLLSLLPGWAYGFVIILAFGAGVIICNYADRRLEGHDHPGIVWDEFVGLWLALASVPASWTWWLLGFLVFRCFDIFKPWPISVIDRKIGGGFGVMLDDLVAGLGAWLVLMIFVWLI